MSDDDYKVMNAGPYRTQSPPDGQETALKRMELSTEMGRVTRVVRALFNRLTPGQRVAMIAEFFAGHCRHCGLELRGTCHCQNDE